jgi:hypothetical protein
VSEMRQAVRGGRQILLPRTPHGAKPEFKVWQRYPAQTSERLADKDLYFPFQTLRYIGMAARGVLSSLSFSPITGRQKPIYSCDGRWVAAFASNFPIAGSPTWTGGGMKLLCRESLALSTAVSSVMCPSKVQL